MNHNQTVGQFGEKIAVRYLESRGYKIVDLNAKKSYKEIDIIAMSGKTLVFVEVKTRTSFSFGSAEDAMSYKKMKNLKQDIGIYLRNNKNNYNDIRLDFIAVDIDRVKKKANLKHYKDII
jgi:putative endonuclease